MDNGMDYWNNMMRIFFNSSVVMLEVANVYINTPIAENPILR